MQDMGYITRPEAHEAGVNIAYGTDSFSSMQPPSPERIRSLGVRPPLPRRHRQRR